MSDGHNNQHENVFESDKQRTQQIVDDRRVIRTVRSFMERSSKYREPFLHLARKAREVYETWQPTSRSMIQRANLKLPFGFTIIETQVPQLVDIFFKDDEVITFEGQDIDDAVWEKLVTDFHNKQLREMQFAAKGPALVKSIYLDGTGFAKVPYRFKEIETVRRETQVDPETGEPQQIKLATTEVLFDQPDFELISIFDFFPDWSIKRPGDVQGMRGLVHRTWRTLASLKSAKITNADGTKEGRYKNLDQLDFSLRTKGSYAWRAPFFSRDNFKEDFERLQDNREENIKNPGSVEVWEYWGLYDPKGDGNFEERIITIANGDVVIHNEENFYDYKFKPFIACPNYIRDGEFYGIPELSPIRSLIKEANTLRNARLDNVNLSVNPMYLADRTAGINAKSLFSRPNGVIWTNDMNGIKRLEPGDPSAGSREEMAFIQQDIQTASGSIGSAPTVGQLARTFGRHATGTNLIQSFSSTRLSLKARNFSEFILKPMARIMLMTNRQFVTEDSPIRVSDPNAPNPFINLPPEAFFRNFDLIPKTDFDTGGKEGQLQRMQAVSEILRTAEQSQPGTVKMDVLLEELLRPLLGPQVQRFVRDEEERAQLQAQQLAATQAVNAAQGQAAPQPNGAAAGLGIAGPRGGQ
jgi:hypothetical protein